MFNEANMVETVRNPSTRVLSRGCLALWLAVSLVLAALLLATGAQANGTSAPDGAAGTAAATAEETPPTAEEAPPVVDEGSVEQPAGEAGTEPVSEGPAAQEPEGGSQVAGAASRPTPEDAAGEAAAGEVAPEASVAMTTSTVPGAPSEITVRRAGEVSCERAAIGAPITADRVGGWLNISAAWAVSTAPFAAAVASPAAIAAGAPAGSDGGGSVVENHSPAPVPGPGPGGAGGGSAAGSGSGSASSTAFTLVGLLVQAAPRAMRRLRLAQLSWRTSFFVLIPEQPD